MNIVSFIVLLGGLAFFLFGMFTMGDALKRIAGNKMQAVLGNLTSTRFKGVLLGTVVTAVIQSSSATSIMVVSFVSSGIMTLDQSISVIMGANIGTTATGWLLTLAGLDSGSVYGKLFSTTVIFAVVAVIGIVIYMAGKTSAGKNVGVIMVSLSVLMTGMRTMSDAMAPLQTNQTFISVIQVISNPILCILLGLAVTALVQSNSAAVGILQAMSATGMITMGAAVPMLVGMSIGASVPVLLSAITANREGKRTALSYLYFNLLGGLAAMVLYPVFNLFPWGAGYLASAANGVSIAVFNTLFKVGSVVVLFPFLPQINKLVSMSIKDTDEPAPALVDEMLLNYPSQAIEQCKELVSEMAHTAVDNIRISTALIFRYNAQEATALFQREAEVDLYDDKLSSFLVRLNANELTFGETQQSSKLLRAITDIERISDHAENITQTAQQMQENGKGFSSGANAELAVCAQAVQEIMSLMIDALTEDDLDAAYRVEPMEEVIDELTNRLKEGHIRRLQRGECSLEMGFAFNDCLHNFERVADHCSNIAVSVIEVHDQTAAESHHYLHELKQRDSEQFQTYLREYMEKYVERLRQTQPGAQQVQRAVLAGKH